MTGTKPERQSDDHDVVVLIDMLPSRLEGRQQPIEGREWFCRLRIEDRFFEVRLVSDEAKFIPGDRTEAKATFLTWAPAADFVRPNVPVEIWELRRVATGHIKDVVRTADYVTP